MAFVVPDFDKFWINADSLIESLESLIVFAQATERNAFVGPGKKILRIDADGLIVSLYGLIVFA